MNVTLNCLEEKTSINISINYYSFDNLYNKNISCYNEHIQTTDTSFAAHNFLGFQKLPNYAQEIPRYCAKNLVHCVSRINLQEHHIELIWDNVLYSDSFIKRFAFKNEKNNY